MNYKTLFCLLFLALFCSCKKSYTCECNTTITYYSTSNNQFYTVVEPGNKVAYDQKLSNKQAKAACQHEENSVQTNFLNWFTYNSQYTLKVGESVSTSCGLK